MVKTCLELLEQLEEKDKIIERQSKLIADLLREKMESRNWAQVQSPQSDPLKEGQDGVFIHDY